MRLQPGDYGRLRTWASVSWTAFAPLAGWVNSSFGIRWAVPRLVSLTSECSVRLSAPAPALACRVGIVCFCVGSMLAVPAAWMLPVEALRRRVGGSACDTRTLSTPQPPLPSCRPLPGWVWALCHAGDVAALRDRVPACLPARLALQVAPIIQRRPSCEPEAAPPTPGLEQPLLAEEAPPPTPAAERPLTRALAIVRRVAASRQAGSLLPLPPRQAAASPDSASLLCRGCRFIETITELGVVPPGGAGLYGYATLPLHYAGAAPGARGR